MTSKRREEQRIHILGGLILIAVTLVAGSSVFFIMQRHAEQQLEKALQLSLQNYVQLIDSTIHQWVDATVALSTRPVLAQQLHAWQAKLAAPHPEYSLEQIAASFLPTGFSYVRISDSQGEQVAQAGSALSAAELSVPLELAHSTELLWKDGYALRVQAVIYNAGQAVGYVTTETPLPKMTALFADVQRVGKTGELALCAPLEVDMQCFPLALTKTVFTRIPREMRGKPLPMSFALAGQVGVIVSEDYRHQEVVAAYSPVADLGLGTVLKIDTRELYAPVWAQVKRVGPLLGLLLVVGVFMLYWLVRPLIRQLFESERQMRFANAQLRDSETRVRSILDNVVEGIVTLTQTGKIDSFNTAAEAMFGYTAQEMIGQPLSVLLQDIADKKDGHNLQDFMQQAEQGAEECACEMTAIRKDGQTFPLELRIGAVELHGRRYFIAALRDMTERKAAEATILHLANHDPLTDLPNRNLLQDRIDQAISQCKRSQRQFAILFIDLDQFKTINDSLGHHIGDGLLQSVAERLCGCLRDEDTVARQGGDEFIVLLTNVSKAEDAALVARKILDLLAEPHHIDGRELHASASIGISLYPNDGEEADMLLQHSDTAMYCAKDAGRNNYQFFTTEMNANAAERLALATSLRHALHRGELELHYQPIVSLKHGRTMTAEALMRWRHPELGYVSPALFIPIAEDSGLISALGEWAMQTACRQLKKWQAQGIHLERIVINLSAHQFRQPDLVQRFAQILTETGVRPNQLGLEITESVIMENPQTAIRLLNELKDMGIQLSLDDFGTGYSSLSYLKRFPIDKIKIDKSFVQDLATDPGDAALVSAIIAMAHSLDITVVAEGVETPQQLAFIQQKACEEYQGYYFSQPLAAEQFFIKLTGKLNATG